MALRSNDGGDLDKATVVQIMREGTDIPEPYVILRPKDNPDQEYLSTEGLGVRVDHTGLAHEGPVTIERRPHLYPSDTDNGEVVQFFGDF